jgi:tRNA(Ile)-lysidine synthase
MRVNEAASGALTSEEFAALMAPFAPFEHRPLLAVALSGGRDSLCLTLLAHDWVTKRGGRIIALIVDHGLRPGSAGEAEATRAMVSRLGIDSRVLCWTGAKPQHGIQEAARAARYGLLFEACRSVGALHLLVAHHADDQAETIAMRTARGSGPDGLAGMSSLVEHRDLRILRPLLTMSRDRLTATLTGRGVKWIDDPSNSDSRFERVRLRHAGEMSAPSEAAAPLRSAAEQRLGELAVDLLEFDIDGAVAIDRAGFAKLPRGMAARLLARAVQTLAGRDHPPRRDRLDRAVARLSQAVERGKSGKSQDFTLSECRLMLRQVSGSRRLRWIVRPENGRKCGRNEGQPLVPAAFFACGGAVRTHLD